MPTPLESLSDTKQALGIAGTDDDDLLEQLQAMADEFILRHCGRDFAGGTFTELHPTGGRMIFLANYPVTELTSVKVDPDGAFGAETLLDPAAYTLVAERGVIVSRGGRFGGCVAPAAVQVVYETAADAVPAAVGRAHIDLVGHWYRQVKTNVNLNQLNVLSRNESDIETRYAAADAPVPAAILRTLALYRVPAQ
ncbi:MAG: phage head-tail connector protein [Gemmataceae bacterium]|nr:phage head-tail connector protein [Planctomycetia bacterium]MBX3397210.1 phage head-tail connector protein [Gemmataceae bacterium]